MGKNWFEIDFEKLPSIESSNYLQNQTQNELHHEKNKKIIDRQNSIDSHQSKSKRL